MRNIFLTTRAVLTGGIFALLTLSGPTLGQRGEPNSASPHAMTTPTSGYPGFFDTNMAEPGSIVVEWPPLLLPFIPMPSIQVDYGVTDTLTVGTNALVTTLPWLLGARGASLKVRTMLIGDAEFQSTATFYGSWIGATEFNASWQMATSNNTFKLAPNHLASAQAMVMNVGIESGSESSVNYTNLRLTTLGLGGGYQFIVSETAALSFYALAPAYTGIEADTVGANLNMNMDPRSGQMLWGIARGSFDIKRDEWVYSIGGIYVHNVASGILPWFSATTRW
jgi:hypothetical protein